MKRATKQILNGKSFEYALLIALYERLESITSVEIVPNSQYQLGKEYFDSLTEQEREDNRQTAKTAISFLVDVEPRLSNSISSEDKLQLELASDRNGEHGDVRDVLAIRLLQKWEIGISAKNNHKAVKHSRLSPSIDFGKKWLGIPCSQEYFDSIDPIFNELANLRKASRATATWESLGDYHTSIYKPVLDAFIKELLSLEAKEGGVVAERLISYLIGEQDFYKIIKSKNTVEIQAYNLYGSLNTAFRDQKSKAKISKLKLPTKIIDISYLENSLTTIIITMDQGWQVSFRIHNASSRIEASLKFDINLVSTPHSLFTNQIYLG